MATKILSRIILLIVCSQPINACYAEEDGKALLKAGETADLVHNVKRAAECYEKALALLPPADGNARVRAEAQLAIDLISMRRYGEARRHGFGVAKTVRDLSDSRKLDPDLLITINTLTEACRSVRAPELPEPARRDTLQQFQDVAIALSSSVADSDTVNQMFDDARVHVARLHDDKAEQALKQLLKMPQADAKFSMEIRAAIAALQNKHGKPKMEQDLLAELERKTSPIEARLILARGQIWAGDYNAMKTTLDEALKKLPKDPTENKRLECKINDAFILGLGDTANLKAEEGYIRRNLALVKGDSVLTTEYQRKLAYVLRLMKRDKEAAAIDPRTNGTTRYDFIFTDEEKAAMKKAKEKQTH